MHPPDYFFSSAASRVAALSASNAGIALTSTPSLSASCASASTSSWICARTRSSSVGPSSAAAAAPRPKNESPPWRPFLSHDSDACVFFCSFRYDVYLPMRMGS